MEGKQGEALQKLISILSPDTLRNTLLPIMLDVDNALLIKAPKREYVAQGFVYTCVFEVVPAVPYMRTCVCVCRLEWMYLFRAKIESHRRSLINIMSSVLELGVSLPDHYTYFMVPYHHVPFIVVYYFMNVVYSVRK